MILRDGYTLTCIAIDGTFYMEDVNLVIINDEICDNYNSLINRLVKL